MMSHMHTSVQLTTLEIAVLQAAPSFRRGGLHAKDPYCARSCVCSELRFFACMLSGDGPCLVDTTAAVEVVNKVRFLGRGWPASDGDVTSQVTLAS